MNTSALPQQHSLSSPRLYNPYKFIRINFSATSLSVDEIRETLIRHQYDVLADLSASRTKERYCLLIEADVSTLELTSFSKWFMKQVKPELLHSKLENKSGDVIAECKLYCVGNKSF